MCDLKKYTQIYEEIKKLQPEDTLELILKSEDPEEREFYGVVGDFLLQEKQKAVIEANLF